jgi:hypothetical protein
VTSASGFQSLLFQVSRGPCPPVVRACVILGIWHAPKRSGLGDNVIRLWLRDAAGSKFQKLFQAFSLSAGLNFFAGRYGRRMNQFLLATATQLTLVYSVCSACLVPSRWVLIRRRASFRSRKSLASEMLVSKKIKRPDRVPTRSRKRTTM